MAIFRWVFGGMVGAALGIAIWAGLVYLTGYRFGFAAAFLGIFIGMGIAAAAGLNRGQGAAIFAGAFALLSVFAGKGAVAWVYSQKFLEEAALSAGDITDEYLISCLADEIVIHYELEGYGLDYPAGADLDYPDSEGDYPEDIWAEAESQWFAMSAEEQQAYRSGFDMTGEEAQLSAFLFALIFSVGLFDFVWIGLAVSSAYKIVRDVPKPKSAETTIIEEPVPSFFPGLPPPNTGSCPAVRASQSAGATPAPFIPGAMTDEGGQSGDLRRAG